ncbi:MAG TPA: hypothetical protein VFC18_05310 [Burkholderiales bacterium]|nr:hypothetical protein [Burkholderiales bacterium]
MSAAATAAGYLYASGRLRGRGAKDEAEGEQTARPEPKSKSRERPERPAPRREVRVAVYAPEEKPRRAPKIQYRTRRWKPESPHGE